ncbi:MULTISPECIES: hypothetical protein [unclassified Exiguobacterium]|uniref:hypothetical protein n=1 Tax=unclassified Exiguobacterium TaxID=2644629 RepID=UPI001BE8C4AF|nr:MULTISPECIES: hypothetical protein [unclassified Exiguobacterium]
MKQIRLWLIILFVVVSSSIVNSLLKSELQAFEVGKFEFGKYDNFDEALAKGLTYDMNKLIYTTRHDGVTIVMYTTIPDPAEFQDNSEFQNKMEALVVQFFEGNNEEGWELLGPRGWTHYENDNFTSYSKFLREYDDAGNVEHSFNVGFGEVNNPEIDTIETKSHNDNTFTEATMIQKGPYRYYFQIGEDAVVRGISVNGEIVDQQGS